MLFPTPGICIIRIQRIEIISCSWFSTPISVFPTFWRYFTFRRFPTVACQQFIALLAYLFRSEKCRGAEGLCFVSLLLKDAQNSLSVIYGRPHKFFTASLTISQNSCHKCNNNIYYIMIFLFNVLPMLLLTAVLSLLSLA